MRLSYLLAFLLPAVLLLPMPMFTRFILYHPTQTPLKQLERGDWRIERVEVAPGIEVNGLVRPAKTAGAPWLIYFGGNAMGLDAGQAILAMTAGEAPWGLCAFAYRGYDGSDGSPSQEALLSDARRVGRALIDNHGATHARIFLMGQSLGTGIAADLAAHMTEQDAKPGGLILLSPYTSIAQVFDDHVPILPISWLVADPYRTDELLDQLRGPILLIHGTADRVIGFDHSRTLAARLGSRARLVALDGRGHNDLWEDRRTVLAIRDFIGSVPVDPPKEQPP